MPTRLGLAIMLGLWLSAAAPSVALADEGDGGPKRVGVGPSSQAVEPSPAPASPTTGTPDVAPRSVDPSEWIRIWGHCRDSRARWNIRIIPEPGAFDVGIRIIGARGGQSWSWDMRQNGYSVDDGRRTTRYPRPDERGEALTAFTVFRDLTDTIGEDAIGMVARFGDTVCRPYTKIPDGA